MDRCSGWYTFNPEDPDAPDPVCNTTEQHCMTCSGICTYDISQDNEFLFRIDTDPYEMVRTLACFDASSR